MKKPSIMNRNIYPASLVAWCQTLDKEAVHRAILECTTQMELNTDDSADDSSEVSAQGSDEYLREDKAK